MAENAKILRVCAADGGARLLITAEYQSEGTLQRETLTAFAARLQELPKAGVVSSEELEHLRYEDALCKALAAGLRSLSAGGCSPARLVQKLCAKGFERQLAQDATAELMRRGCLDESDGAIREAERGMQKLWGNKRILMDLRAKGYGNAALQAAKELLDGEDSIARCCRFLRKKRIAQIPDDAGLQKLISALIRYGYTQGEIRAALQQYFS